MPDTDITVSRDLVLTLLERLEVAESKVTAVVNILDSDAARRAAHALVSECGCSYKDCYECGKWCRCIHTPYEAMRQALKVGGA